MFVVIGSFEYVFSENGLVYHKNGKLHSKQVCGCIMLCRKSRGTAGWGRKGGTELIYFQPNICKND